MIAVVYKVDLFLNALLLSLEFELFTYDLILDTPCSLMSFLSSTSNVFSRAIEYSP